MALKQEKTVYPIVGFLGFASVFELLHFTILFTFFKIIGIEFILPSEEYFIISFIVLGALINYLIFFRNNNIEKTYEYYQNNRFSSYNQNAIFISYLFILFSLIFIEGWYFNKYIN